jgi:hypothetical protein
MDTCAQAHVWEGGGTANYIIQRALDAVKSHLTFIAGMMGGLTLEDLAGGSTQQQGDIDARPFPLHGTLLS